MNTLVLRLAGPMQSWGTDCKFVMRTTHQEPTRSGIIGMLAAALGMERGESLVRFDSLKFGVRVEQRGAILRDFHTVAGKDTTGVDKTYVTHRFYLTDAVFIVGLESDDLSFLIELEKALEAPYYPIYLGRKSCPPQGRLTLGIREGVSVRDVLLAEPWQASDWYKEKMERDVSSVGLDIMLESVSGPLRVHDRPVTFGNMRRYTHSYYDYITDAVVIQFAPSEHDAFEAI